MKTKPPVGKAWRRKKMAEGMRSPVVKRQPSQQPGTTNHMRLLSRREYQKRIKEIKESHEQSNNN